MAERFRVGSTAYTKDGRAYTVEEVDDGMVYCSLPNGTETDFPEESLINETEWASRSHGQEDVIYSRIKQSKAYSSSAAGLNGSAAAKILQRADGLSPGILDYTAYTVASSALKESVHGDYIEHLSIVKCRAAFDEQPPEARLSALAYILGADAKILAKVADHGDNLISAMLTQGITPQIKAFEDFCDRPRK